MTGRRNFLTAAAAAVLAVGLTTPTGASAGLVGDVVNQVNDTVDQVRDGLGGGGSEGGGGTPTPLGGTPPSYTPPEHGTNPHGQGTGAVVDLTPENTQPLPYEEGGGSEEVVVGRSRGEQNGDEYHGHISILTLLGTELVGVDTDEGETDTGPLGPLNSVLGDICTDSGGSLCLEVLGVSSSTDSNGSSNSFSVVDASVGTGGFGVTARAIQSEGNISDDGTCQTSEGSSTVAAANAFDAVTAELLTANSTSQACNDGSGDSQSNSGSGITILGAGVPIPASGCEDGTPNTVFDPPLLNVLLQAVCNADDSNGSQDEDPYGVREALSVFLLPVLGDVPLAKVTTAAGESAAVAPEPSGPACPDPSDPACPGPPDDEGDDGVKVDPEASVGSRGDAPGGPSGDAPDRAELPFTGADVLTLALIGGGVMGFGLLAMALVDRNRRRQNA